MKRSLALGLILVLASLAPADAARSTPAGIPSARRRARSSPAWSARSSHAAWRSSAAAALRWEWASAARER